MWCFNTWAREEPNRHLNMCASASTGFNTWAREEPNCRFCGGLRSDLEVSILGLARSPTDLVRQYIESILFQYLGSRGAQQPPFKDTVIYHKFQYLGSRGAQLKRPGNDITDCKFQYLGSRGAQLFMSAITSDFFSFNTWAREEPNGNPPHEAPYGAVSILGLARSPTRTIILMDGDSFLFQYLGSRGAQPSLLDASCTNASFNTWAREEPNLHHLFHGDCIQLHVSILGLARSPTAVLIHQHIRLDVSILGLARSPTSGGLSAGEQKQTVSILGLARSQTSGGLSAGEQKQPVSILGLARSPTCDNPYQFFSMTVSILGLARSPTRFFFHYITAFICFNTWAREEPNLHISFPYYGILRFNTWAREEPNSA